jgi:hypothetical protein
VKTIRTVLLPVLFLLMFQGGHLSWQSSLGLDILVGFNGLFRAGRWTPLRVTVMNIGRAIQGRLQIAVTRYDPFQLQTSGQSVERR